MFDSGAGGLLPHATRTRLEAWSTSELEHFLQTLHPQMEMVRSRAVVLPPSQPLLLLLLLLLLTLLPVPWLLRSPAAPGLMYASKRGRHDTGTFKAARAYLLHSARRCVATGHGAGAAAAGGRDGG